MENIELKIMTRRMCHEFYKGYDNDPALYMDMSKFNHYTYNCDKVDLYFDKQQDSSRMVYGVLLDGRVIGEIKLKDMDYEKKECTLGIALQNDGVKCSSISERRALFGHMQKKEIIMLIKNVITLFASWIYNIYIIKLIC